MKSKLLIATAALLASFCASAGELDGKALTCLSVADNSIRGIEFSDGKVIHWNTEADGTEAILKKYNVGTYWARPEQVIYQRVPNAAWKYYLDRVTLLLQLKAPSGGEALYQAQCEVSPSLDALAETIEAQRRDLQSSLDERMKDNKI